MNRANRHDLPTPALEEGTNISWGRPNREMGPPEAPPAPPPASLETARARPPICQSRGRYVNHQ